MGLFDKFIKKRSKDDNDTINTMEIQQRREYIENRHFCERFAKELKKFHALELLQVNPHIPEEESFFGTSEAIPLLMFSNESIGMMDYEEFLAENEEKIWQNLLLDDSIECLSDDINSQYPNGCDIFIAFTNDCSAMDGFQGMFGLYITY